MGKVVTIHGNMESEGPTGVDHTRVYPTGDPTPMDPTVMNMETDPRGMELDRSHVPVEFDQIFSDAWAAVADAEKRMCCSTNGHYYIEICEQISTMFRNKGILS